MEQLHYQNQSLITPDICEKLNIISVLENTFKCIIDIPKMTQVRELYIPHKVRIRIVYSPQGQNYW